MSSTNTKPTINVPHFKGTLKKARASDYTTKKATLDIIDNIITLCSSLLMIIEFGHNSIKQIRFSDNYKPGFDKINEDGECNPFNMAHVKDGHNDDNETSEFGMGFKLASIFLCNKLSVYTRVDNTYYLVMFDFVIMSRLENPIDSYEATKWTEITEQEYMEIHPFEYGSTICLEDIIHDNHSFESKEKTISNFHEWIQDGYSKIIAKTGINIVIKDSIEHSEEHTISSGIDLFEDPDCKPFNTTSNIYINEDTGDILCETVMMDGKSHYFMNSDRYVPSRKPQKGDQTQFIKIKQADYESSSIKSKFSKALKMKFESTFIWCKNFKQTDECYLTLGMIDIYRADRKYATLTYKKHRTNGAQNYTYHKIEYTSKKINRMIGMNYNKGINDSINTPLVVFLTEIQREHEKHYTSDTSTNGFYNNLLKIALDKKILSMNEVGGLLKNREDKNKEKEAKKQKKRVSFDTHTTSSNDIVSSMNTSKSSRKSSLPTRTNTNAQSHLDNSPEPMPMPIVPKTTNNTSEPSVSTNAPSNSCKEHDTTTSDSIQAFVELCSSFNKSQQVVDSDGKECSSSDVSSADGTDTNPDLDTESDSNRKVWSVRSHTRTRDNETTNDNTSSNNPESSSLSQSQMKYHEPKTIAYFGIKKNRKEENRVPMDNDGSILGKIGYTNQSITKRFSGAELTNGWEHVFYEEIDDTFAEKDTGDKIRIESIIISSIRSLDYVKFKDNSQEQFTFPLDKRFEIKDIIYDILKTHRPQPC